MNFRKIRLVWHDITHNVSCRSSPKRYVLAGPSYWVWFAQDQVHNSADFFGVHIDKSLEIRHAWKVEILTILHTASPVQRVQKSGYFHIPTRPGGLKQRLILLTSCSQLRIWSHSTHT